jgi:hypothetical protein
MRRTALQGCQNLRSATECSAHMGAGEQCNVRGNRGRWAALSSGGCVCRVFAACGMNAPDAGQSSLGYSGDGLCMMSVA